MGTKAQGQGMKDHPSAGWPVWMLEGLDCSHFLGQTEDFIPSQEMENHQRV